MLNNVVNNNIRMLWEPVLNNYNVLDSHEILGIIIYVLSSPDWRTRDNVYI